MEQKSLGALLARPAALALAFRRASALLALEVECLDVPAAWILHSAGWPATVGEHGIALGPAPPKPLSPAEAVNGGPMAAVREALRTLPPSNSAPATLFALPSPVTLANAAGVESVPWSRSLLQAYLRSLGELNVLAGVMFEEDDGASALSGVLDHYQLTAICIRLPTDARLPPPGALVARALPLEALLRGLLGDRDMLCTSDGPVSSLVSPEELLRAARVVFTPRRSS